MELNSEQKTEILKLVRGHLEHILLDKEDVQIPPYSIYNEKYGIFVTLHINKRLRGCIGHIIAYKELRHSIIEMTESAAFQDPRFTALTKEELDKVDIEVSILSPLQNISSYNEIELGKHGILLKSGLHQAVFLPQVAPEQGWTLDETLGNLANKAGLSWNDYKNPDVNFQVFTALVFSE